MSPMWTTLSILASFMAGAVAVGILAAATIAAHRLAVSTLERTVDLALRTSSRTNAITKRQQRPPVPDEEAQKFSDEELTRIATKNLR